MTLEYLQNYWWLLISVLGAALVFLLFVQGGQSMLFEAGTRLRRDLIIASIGRKWELTFTTLVTFGGAFFASFPLFYSTSFGGAYWLWALILFSFVLQAVSYEYRNKKGNIYGSCTFDAFLFINGCVGCILLGVAVAMMFFGAEFTVSKGNLLDTGAPVISTWAPTHGFEAIFDWRNLILGFAILFLARTQACLYMMNNVVADDTFFDWLKRRTLANAVIFLVFFLTFLALLLTANGYSSVTDAFGNTSVTPVPFKYALNYVQLWWALAALVLGVVLVLFALGKSIFSRRYTNGIWFSGLGTALVVLSLFWVSGYNDTAYYPSLLDPASSLSIRNSSSSEFTLSAMSLVSIIIPFVLAYIAYCWYALDRKKTTPAEAEAEAH